MNTQKFTLDLVTGTLTEDDAKRYFSRFGWFAFTFYLVLSLFQSLAATVIRLLAPSLLSNMLFLQIFSVVPIYAVAFPIAYLVLRPLPSVAPMGEKLRIRDFVCAACICEALMLVGNYISSALLMVFENAMGGTEIQNPVEVSVESQPMWMTVVFSVILAPVLEELFFRGVVCKKLLALGERYAIVLSAAFFALCHGNFFQLFYSFIIGCFFALIYVKTGKLIYSILLHMTVNLLGTVVVSWVLEFSDYESLINEGSMLSSENVLSVVVLLMYEILILGISVFGLVTLFKSRKKISLDEGLLPPPKGRAVQCVLLNAGVAAAIAVFAFTLLASLLL